MSENYQGATGNWVHVNSYTKDDGAHVNEYWRRHPGNGRLSDGNFIGRNSSNDILSGNYQLGEIIPPYLQNGGEISLEQNLYNNSLIGGITWTSEDEISRRYKKHLSEKYGKLKLGDTFRKYLYIDFSTALPFQRYGKRMVELTQNATDDFKMARKDPNATIFANTYEIPNTNIRKFLSTDSRVTDN